MKSAPEKSAAEVEETLMFHMKQWANYMLYEFFFNFLECVRTL